MNCTTNCCNACCAKPSKINAWLLILRVATWLFFVMAGIGKFQATPEMQEMIGWAAHLLGLTFLPALVWFQIAQWAEIIAWVLLVLWLFTRVGASLLLLVMLVAMNMKWWNIDMMSANNAVLDAFLAVIAISLSLMGGWKWSVAWLFSKKCDPEAKASCGCCAAGCTCGDCPDCKK